jgi:hypothetical protein
MTTITDRTDDGGPTTDSKGTPDARRRVGWMSRHWTASLLCVAVVLLGGAFFAVRAMSDTTQQRSAAVPQSAAMEQRLGVRFSRIAVVGDGGLIVLSYVVLDPEKATVFQSDREHPPVLASEARPLSTQRVSIMRNGHLMRAGATYYFVYENTKGALQPGELAAISYRGLVLAHFPVL